jgi:two-component system, cell cycle response regulator DivK
MHVPVQINISQSQALLDRYGDALFILYGEQAWMLMEVNQSVVDSSCSTRPDLIWVVEDHEDSLLLLNFILNDLCNAQVISFGSGQAVLEEETSLPPDLILLDIILPDIHGVEVMQQFKQDPLMRHIPIVAVTALARLEDRNQLLQAGFTDYVSKPYLLDDIEIILGRYLKRKPTCGE